ncbi:unnamed protein product [Linum tenue]|uniref:Uncharacterized protein n=1 Tax=Linum tenue TaxID=586396 RepID=A0AAV0LLX7_9ROSI|nr:unnamed protein product [Linum tenue]
MIGGSQRTLLFPGMRLRE